MNFDIVEKFVQYTEENYHGNISNEVIENLTGNSAEYVRNVFKKIVNISINEYGIRRQLALIIQEIKESNNKLKNSNLLPWKNTNSFCKSFKEKYVVTPSNFIKNYNADVLQQKIEINELKISYKDDTRIIESLIRKFGGKRNALIYILSLKPYLIYSKDWLFISDVAIKNVVIRRKQSIKKNFFAGIITRFYNKRNKFLEEMLYDTNVAQMLSKQVNNIYNSHQTSLSHKTSLYDKYIVVKDSLKNRLLESIDLKDIINKNTNPSNIVTLWYNKFKNGNFEDGVVYVPTELIYSIPNLENQILFELLLQEQGYKHYNSIRELGEYLIYDFNKPVNNCIKCINSNKCDNYSHSCLYIKSLNKDERGYYFVNLDYKFHCLSVESLCDEIINLIINGLLYLNYYE